MVETGVRSRVIGPEKEAEYPNLIKDPDHWLMVAGAFGPGSSSDHLALRVDAEVTTVQEQRWNRDLTCMTCGSATSTITREITDFVAAL